MSDYHCFVDDFPRRCCGLLNAFFKQATIRDREVTLLLMACSSGIVIPLERLGEGKSIKQPELDRNRFARAAEHLDGQLSDQIGHSASFGEALMSWRGGQLNSAVGTPDTWPELDNLRALKPSTTVEEIVRILRNSLAHGNIFTRANAKKEIGEVIFVPGGTNRRTGKEIPCSLLVVMPEQLRAFLVIWFSSLASLLSSEPIATDTIDYASSVLPDEPA